jgi:ribosomal protein S18 acetylase RimI-like enzyme
MTSCWTPSPGAARRRTLPRPPSQTANRGAGTLWLASHKCHTLGHLHFAKKSVASQIRPYRAGDEDLIIELSNRSLAPYAGWVPRTRENWRWSILRRPGVQAADLLVLESEGKLSAYAVLGPDGSVLDFAVDPDQRAKKRRSYIKEMVQALERCARSRDCDTLMFSLPASDQAVDAVLREAGYVAERSDYFSIGILNPQILLQQVLSARRSRLRSLRLNTFVFELTPGEYPFLLMKRLRVRLQPDVQVDDGSAAADYPRDCVIRVDLSSLTELIFSRVPLATLLARAQLTIEPDSSADEARELLHALVIDTEWHLPPYDGF